MESSLKQAAIANDVYGKPIPILSIPQSHTTNQDVEDAKKVMKDFKSGAQAYLIIPAGWEFEIATSSYDPKAVSESLQIESTSIASAVLANFMELGVSKGGGSFALSKDQSDVFLNNLQVYATNIAGGLERGLFNKLAMLNFGRDFSYCEIKSRGISDKLGRDLAEVIAMLVEKGILTADDILEESLRLRLNLPPMDKETARDKNPTNEKPEANEDAEAEGKGKKDEVDSGSGTKKKEETGKDSTGKEGEGAAGENKKTKDAEKEARARGNSTTEKKNNQSKVKQDENGGEEIDAHEMAERNSIYKTITKTSKGLLEKFDEAMASTAAEYEAVANLHLEKNRSGLPNWKEPAKAFKKEIEKVFSSEFENVIGLHRENYNKRVDSKHKLASKKDDKKDELLLRVFVLHASIANDVKKVASAVYLNKIISSVGGQKKKTTAIGFFVGDAIRKYKTSSGARAMIVNNVTAVSSLATSSFANEVQAAGDEIVSVTYHNSSPVAAICKKLRGTTVEAGPEADYLTPPLHHLCKTSVAINTLFTRNNPTKVLKRVPLSKKEIDSGTLLSEDYIQ